MNASFFRQSDIVRHTRNLSQSINQSRLLVFLVIFFLFTVMSSYALTGYWQILGFGYGKSDTALYAHGLWLIAHLQSPISLAYPGFMLNVYLRQHVMPIAFLYGIVYSIMPNLLTLVLFEAVTCTATIAILFILFHQVWESSLMGLILAVIYWVGYSQSPGHFYFENLAAPFVALAALWTWKSQYPKAAVVWGLVILFKEYFAFVAAFAGVILYFRGGRRAGLTLTIGSIIYFLAAFLVVMPWAQPKMQFLGLFDYLGSRPTEIFANFFLHPGLWIERVFSPRSIEYLFELFVPYGIAGFGAPLVVLPAAPLIALNLLLGGNHATQQLVSHYSIAIMPLFGAGGGIGLKRVWDRFQAMPTVWRYAGAIGLISLIGVSFVSAMRDHPYQLRRAWAWNVSTEMHARDVQTVLAQIPPTAAVGATDQLMPYISQRQIVVNPLNLVFQSPEFVVIDQAYAQCLPSLLETRLAGKALDKDCYSATNWLDEFTQSRERTAWSNYGYQVVQTQGSVILLQPVR